MGYTSKAPPWSDAELGFLADRPDWSARRVADALGRTIEAVRLKRQKLRNGWSAKTDHWTPEEDDIVLATPHLTKEQVAARLIGRTPKAVEGRRAKLVRDRAAVFVGGRKSPFDVAGRPLIAKTCSTCGLLLTADWFWFNTKTRQWSTYCARCRARQGVGGKQRYHGDRVEQNKRSARASKDVKQALTLPSATRSGQPWLEADHVVLADPDLSIVEKALRLQRSYLAVAHAVSRHGYPSHKGLGDPDRDQWIIDNPNELERQAS